MNLSIFLHVLSIILRHLLLEEMNIEHRTILVQQVDQLSFKDVVTTHECKNKTANTILEESLCSFRGRWMVSTFHKVSHVKSVIRYYILSKTKTWKCLLICSNFEWLLDFNNLHISKYVWENEMTHFWWLYLENRMRSASFMLGNGHRSGSKNTYLIGILTADVEVATSQGCGVNGL